MTTALARRRTIDRGPPVAPGGTAPIHTTEKISENRERLPNGNLLCRNVPIARVGMLVYGPGEVPVKPGPNGMSYVERTADTLFAPETIGSISSAAVTDDHPDDDVTPQNWRRLSCGFALNVRRGTGADADVVLADLMITDRRTIDAIEAGKVEVSLGYDADYMDKGGGIGQQFNIIGNHIALVRKGRCGPRCAIGDSVFQPPTTKERHMANQRVKIRGAVRRTLDQETVIAAARQRFADAEAELAAAEAGECGEEDGGADNDTHIHIHTGDRAPAAAGESTPTRDAAVAALEGRVEGIEGNVSEILALLKGKTGDEKTYADDDMCDEAKAWRAAKAKKTADAAAETEAELARAGTGDSAALHTSYTELIQHAEVLSPGFKVPTFDAATTRAKTVDRMCAVRRKVLDTAYATADGKMLIEGVNGGQPFDCVSMDCAATAVLFKAAAAAKMSANNQHVTRDSAHIAKPVIPTGAAKTPSIADINKANAEFWSRQK